MKMNACKQEFEGSAPLAWLGTKVQKNAVQFEDNARTRQATYEASE